MWIKNITKHIFFFYYLISLIWQTFKCSGTVFTNLAWYRRTKDLVPLFDQKLHLFENSSLKIMAQLHGKKIFIRIGRPYDPPLPRLMAWPLIFFLCFPLRYLNSRMKQILFVFPLLWSHSFLLFFCAVFMDWIAWIEITGLWLIIFRENFSGTMHQNQHDIVI